MAVSTRSATGAVPVVTPAPKLRLHDVLSPPMRTNNILTKDQILNVIRILKKCHNEKAAGDSVSTADPVRRAAVYSGVSHTTLRLLWESYERSQCKELAPSFSNSAFKERMKKLDSSWVGCIREKVLEIRMSGKRAVEMPTIQKWLRDEMGILGSGN